MFKAIFVSIVVAAMLCAQAPTGIISGTVTDETGAVIPNAAVTVSNPSTGLSRKETTNSAGVFSVSALQAGEYQVRVEAKGFRTLERAATVTAGNTTTVNAPMTVGGAQEVVTVEAASSQINYESHQIQGVVGRTNIQDLPLNGRSFIQLAQLEPGVTISTGSTAQFNALFTVSTLGSGSRTAYTVDGGNVSDNIDVGGGIASMNFSQEVVQEFQLSENNFDLATPIAAGGAINIVTRSGSNDWHGSAYFFYRDHNMAAYPNLVRDPNDLHPFFVRRNPGVWLGGPIKKDKLFFFFNYEYMNQVQALDIVTTDPAFVPLIGTYGSPYHDNLFSVRFDYHINDKNTAFLRYSHDGNAGFSQSLEYGDPSNWAHNTNWADQGILGVTSTLTPNVVNDARVQFNYWANHNFQAAPSDCSAPCVAGALPNVFTFVGSNFPAVGPNFNAPQARNTRRYQLVEAISWQRGSHRLKFGGDLNPTRSAGLWGFCSPMCVGAFSPEYVQSLLGAATPLLFPTMPSVLHSDADVLNLPVLLYQSSIFSGVGVGNPSTPAPYGADSQKWFNQYRAYAQDTWKVTPSLTVNYGLAWNAQTGFYNTNLPKPAYLAPILGTGSNNLGPTVNNTREFQPAFGFSWSPFKDNKTVIRGGAGIYWDSTPGYYKLREAPVIGPVGDGRSTLAGSAFTNIYPGIVEITAAGPQTVPVGANFQLNGLYNLTVGQFVNLVAQELPSIAAKLAPPNPQTSGAYSVTGIDIAKQGVEIYPTHFPLARSYQTSIGVQRQLSGSMFIEADWARRQGRNVSLGEIDDNHFNNYVNGVQSPVIPICSSAQLYVPGQECSSGPITFWTDEGDSLYNALLVKLSKRLSHRFQFIASYAFQRGWDDAPYNVLDWSAGWGQYLPHQNLNVAGIVNLPWGFDLSVNSSIISRTPVEPVVPNIQLNGVDLGTSPYNNQPLPNLGYNCLNAGCGKAQLAAAVAQFNSTYAGTKDSQGKTIPSLVLPPDYSLSAPVFSQDFRLSKTFTFVERYRFTVLAEMFNAFNISNLTIGTYQLDTKAAAGATQTYSFGQPTGRVLQTFGSGGPRALQLAARFSF